MVARDDVRRAYDEVAETYADHRSDDDVGMAILASFLDSLSASPRVLDAGCGQGRPVLETVDAVGDGVGLDFSRAQLRLDRENVPGPPLVQGDLTDLPFRSGVFDGVVAFWSLIHVPLEDHPAVVEEFARTLRQGGQALVFEASERWCGDHPDWLGSGVEMEWHMAGVKATRRQLRESGFAVVDTWDAPESLGEEGNGASESEDDWPWTFLQAKLES